MTIRRPLSFIAVAVVVGTVSLQLAIAHDREFAIHATKPARAATESPTAQKYTGKVTSPKPACRRNRQVILQIVDSPISRSTRTRRNGRWNLRLPTPASDYQVLFSVLFRDLSPGPEHKHACRAVVRTYSYSGTGIEAPAAERG
jgi:hypothetical protein